MSLDAKIRKVEAALALVEAIARARDAGLHVSLPGDDASRVAIAAAGPEPVRETERLAWHVRIDTLHDELRGGRR
jgi:hypothetical protein